MNMETETNELILDKTRDIEFQALSQKLKFRQSKKIYEKVLQLISSFLGLLFRIIFQIGELYICIIILNIIFEYEIIYLCSTVSVNLFIHYLFSFALGYFSVYPISILFWEFFKFNWLNSFFPFQTVVDLLKVIPGIGKYSKNKANYLNKLQKDIKYKVEGLFGLLLILLLSFFAENKLLYETIFAYSILTLNLVKYILIFLIYIFYSIIFVINIYLIDFYYFMKKCFFQKKKYYDYSNNDKKCYIPLINQDSEIIVDPFIFSMIYSIYIDINEKELKKYQEKNVKENIKVQKADKASINVLTNTIRIFQKPLIEYLMKEYSKRLFIIYHRPLHKKCSFIVIIKFILIFSIIIYSGINLTFKSTIIFLVVFILAFPIQTSPWFLHKLFKTFQCSSNNNNLEIYQIINFMFRGFKYINYVSSFIFFISIIALTIISFIVTDIHNFSDINKTFNKTGLFIPKQSFTKSNNTRQFLKSAICLTKFHGLNIIQIASLAQITYYDDIEQIKFYLNHSVFSDNNKVRISDMKILNRKNGIIVMTDIDIKNQNGVRVFSIRGTTAHKDILLDAEMFASSATLSLIRQFPLFGNTESEFVSIISGFLTFPLKQLNDYTLTNLYMNELSEYYEKYNNTDRNIIFTGHSLGGGLAKFMGFKYNKQSISFSGPGVTPLEYNYSHTNSNKNYAKQYFVDVVPDNDIVPRLETTSGTIFRVICEESLFSFKCHSIDRTFCMMGMMCHEDESTSNICEGIFTNKELMKMKNILNLK